MATLIDSGHTCQSIGCDKAATLQCPTCKKLGIYTSFFCDQQCFKSFWSQHKVVHKAAQLIPQQDILESVGPNLYPGYKFSGTLRPWPQSPRRFVPESIPRPDYALHPEGVSIEEREARSQPIKVLDDAEKEGLKVACRLGRQCLDAAAAVVEVGMTTDEIDRIVHETAVELQCYPSPLGYYQFPKSCCTSVNEVICHGIPDERPLADGDICNLDVTVYHRGFHGDLNETFLVGNVDEDSVKLVRTSYQCMWEGINIVRPGVKFREIGGAIQKHANANGCSVVRSYCGHGIHKLFHTAPNVPHYAMPWYEIMALYALNLIGIENKAIGVMRTNNSFTIEPMINAGSWTDTQWPDDWTAVTTDGKRSAQFENTMIVTDTGCEVLTVRNNNTPWFEDQLAKNKG